MEQTPVTQYVAISTPYAQRQEQSEASPLPPLPSSDGHSRTPSPPPPLPSDEPPVSQEDALDLALRSAQVPIVADRILHLLFGRYNSQDGKSLMNSFRYLRCLKECSITVNEEDVPTNGTRWLSYGVVSIVFNDALKIKPEEPPASHSAHGHIKHSSTSITLKGIPDTRATAISYSQFLYAMKMLALRLYADVIQSEFGVAVELLKDPVKDTAARQALELLLQDKLVPLAVKSGR